MKTTTNKATETTTETKSLEPREIVIGCMHWNGAAKTMIDNETWARAYLFCDGFGSTMTVKIANSQDWDWSHVRDSSPRAIRMVAHYLTDALVKNGRIAEAFEALWAAKTSAA